MPIEHIIPESKNGSNELENLALSCHGCNGSKYDKTHGFDPITEDEFPLFHPRLNKWITHFEWNEDFSEILGLTSTGRATINTLKMNRPNLINLRFALYIIGYHPPKTYNSIKRPVKSKLNRSSQSKTCLKQASCKSNQSKIESVISLQASFEERTTPLE